MKIALIGYGIMGRQVEEVAVKGGHTIIARCNSQQWELAHLEKADICIEFSRPECAIANVDRLAALQKNVVIGTTGWYDRLPDLKAIVDQHNIGALYGPNFSLGVFLLLEIIAHASKVMNGISDYDVAGVEYHHNKKRDRPSGTAKEIAKVVDGNMSNLDAISFESVRCGSIPGTHTLLFDSSCDSISITHTAKNREGFAQGAVRAAEWLQGRRGLYTFNDCANEILTGGNRET